MQTNRIFKDNAADLVEWMHKPRYFKAFPQKQGPLKWEKLINGFLNRTKAEKHLIRVFSRLIFS